MSGVTRCLRRCGWKWRSASWSIVGGAIASFGDCALAQNITLDGSLGPAQTLTGPDYVIPQAVGQTVGSNLFHSFGQFSLDTDESAGFQSAANIRNILSRVTGGFASLIDGLIYTKSPSVNLFLINPNGIVFGPNASIDVGGATRGSFVATTVDALVWPNGKQFSATNPGGADSLLKIVGDPSGFISSLRPPKPITSSGSTLRVYEGQSLLLLGGDVTLDGSFLYVDYSEGGRIDLGGVAGAGTVGLDVDGNNLRLSFPDDVTRADVSLTNGSDVDVSAEDGGSIVINARNLDISGNSNVSGGIKEYLGSVGSQAGDITLNATGSMSIAYSLIGSQVRTGSVGNGSNINIQAGSLSLTDGAALIASVSGQGNAGSVNIKARDTVSFDGVSSGAFSSTGAEARGNGGNVNLTAGSLILVNGAQLTASTFGQGNAGSVNIKARDTVSFDGVSSDGLFSSGAFSSVEASAVGQGGDVNLTTRLLSVTNGAQLTASTFGQGDAGSVNIKARDTVSFDGVSSDGFSSGAFSSVGASAVGQWGGINITTEALSIMNDAVVNVSSEGSGNAGNLEVAARSLHLNNQAALNAESVLGRGGNIQLWVGELLLLSRDSLISAVSGTAGSNGLDGNINIVTKFLVTAPSENSDVVATGFGRSVGSNIQVNAQGIFGTQFREQRTPQSDIIATGTVELITPDVDLSRGLVNLPSELVDASGLIVQGCPGVRGNADRGGSEFIITGRGGLPPHPGEALRTDAVQVDLMTLNPGVGDSSSPAVSTNPTTPVPAPIVEAQGWVINALGEVVLTTHPPTVTPHSPWGTLATCYTPETSS